MSEGNLNINDLSFPKFDYLFYFKTVFKSRRFKAIYKQFYSHYRRPTSRRFIQPFIRPHGLEVGVGSKTIAPVCYTVLSDGFHSHGNDESIAQQFFSAYEAPFHDETFSFLLSEHTLEHITNPIKALNEWRRILKRGGHLILFLPSSDRTMDRLRKRTTLDHLIADFEQDVSDDDQTHLPDFIENVIERGLLPGHYEHIPPNELIATGSIHHHVWQLPDIEELLTHLNFKIVSGLDYVADRNDSFAVIAEKL